jgi:hypothetical protein
MAKLSAIASIAALGSALAAAGCSNVLGLKDPTFNDTGHDAAIDTPPIDAPIDMGPGACVPANCQFGCDPSTNACRPAKLWVFITTGQFFGDGIGGRAGADAKCLTTATQSFANRACTAARTHAILTLDAGDAIADMVGKFMIPNTVMGTATLVPVHRADDDTKVANSWNDLVTPNKPALTDVASATSATTDAAGVVWTGFGSSTASNCMNWASKLSTVFGVFGSTRNPPQPATWLGQASDTCNLLHKLLCVCWSGGN